MQRYSDRIVLSSIMGYRLNREYTGIYSRMTIGAILAMFRSKGALVLYMLAYLCSASGDNCHCSRITTPNTGNSRQDWIGIAKHYIRDCEGSSLLFYLPVIERRASELQHSLTLRVRRIDFRYTWIVGSKRASLALKEGGKSNGCIYTIHGHHSLCPRRETDTR